MKKSKVNHVAPETLGITALRAMLVNKLKKVADITEKK